MASSKALFSAAISPTQSYSEFKTDIQQKLLWGQKEWADSKLVKSDRYFFCRNIVHWFNKLIEVKDPKFLVITTFASGSNYRPTFKEVIQAYKLQFGLEGLSGASLTANANYITLWFSTQEFKLRALQEFCMIQNCYVVHSGWLPQQPIVKFQLNWLPPDIQLAEIQSELEKHVPIVSLQKEELDLEDGDTLTTGKVTGSFAVDAVKSIQSLPHFVSVFPYKAHWIIYSRAAMCFNCKWVGHVASQCPTPFCATCRRLLPRSHFCSASGNVASPPLSSCNFVKPDSFSVLLRPPAVPKSDLGLQSSDVSVFKDAKVLPQDFWLQNRPLLPPQKTRNRVPLEVDIYPSSNSEDEFLVSSSMESVLGISAKSSSLTKLLDVVKPQSGSRFSLPQYKPELPLQRSVPGSPPVLWTPPKGAMSLDFDPASFSHKTYSRKHSKKK